MKIKVKVLLLTFVSCILYISAIAQEKPVTSENVTVLKQFVHRLNDTNLATDVILSQDILTGKNLDEDQQEYLLASIDEMRINVQSKDISKLEYINFIQ
ncbi:MAG: hypothetical protein ACN6PN_15380, partial [Sphingobacterium sp.]